MSARLIAESLIYSVTRVPNMISTTTADEFLNQDNVIEDVKVAKQRDEIQFANDPEAIAFYCEQVRNLIIAKHPSLFVPK